MQDKIVVYGMSCSGKTTFARTLIEHTYHCFDAMFPWHLIETLGLSAFSALQHVQRQCTGDRYVLDGWHLSDKEGLLLPQGASVYVVYAPYERIISQYRVSVEDFWQHLSMFRKWYYEVDYDQLPCVHYISNEGQFVERSREHFLTLLKQNL
jgi:GTPase SAR1 family protein